MYDFDRVIDRKSTNDLKWRPDIITKYFHGMDIGDDVIPMWIADTDFACMPEIITAIKNRADKEIFGYCAISKEYVQSIMYWYKTNYSWEVNPSWLVTSPTVVASINIAIRAFTNEGDGVIVQQPVYNPFTDLVQKTKRTVVVNPLKNTNGYFEMDFDLLEKQASNPNNKLLILCSPHNPVGRVWKKEELLKLAEICIKNNVLIFTDEIHSDIIFGENKHYPLPSLSEEIANNCIYSSSLGKTFNVPGLKYSNAIIPNPELKTKFVEMQEAMSLSVNNTFAIEATIAGYSPEGLAWKNALVEYINENVSIVEEWVLKMDKLKLVRPEGTFICWIDVSGLGISEQELTKRLIYDAKVICGTGSVYGEGGENFIRLIVGCPRETLKKALSRLETVLK